MKKRRRSNDGHNVSRKHESCHGNVIFNQTCSGSMIAMKAESSEQFVYRFICFCVDMSNINSFVVMLFFVKMPDF